MVLPVAHSQTGANADLDRIRGDITKLRFDAGTFDAVTCLSVVEHGVDLDAYFREMSRISLLGFGKLPASWFLPPEPTTNWRTPRSASRARFGSIGNRRCTL